ncbi:hypothetical protein HF521_007480 [Silurus meridionalis]|uniref:Uncharacterized protein n=1 Tax=Silurus meridionalis TaxID=175797 RepID=A0A8T0ANW3_SILME|nr:hypothetical protein HF521_007480 [Silurus meridionalis]
MIAQKPNQTWATRPQHQKKHTQQRQNLVQKKSDDPDFAIKTRTMFKIIKLVHHRNNVSHEQPPALTKMEKNLSEVIKPALPNPTTQALIEGNAKNWAYTTMLILKNHYEDTLVEEMAKLQHYPSRGWEECFNTAVLWAKRGIGKRLRNRSIQEAHTLVGDKYKIPTPTAEVEEVREEAETQSVPAASSLPPDTAIAVQASVHAEAETHLLPDLSTQPEPKSSRTTSTMTDPPNDWSPFREEDSEFTLDPPSSPKAQRAPRPSSNPCVRWEEELVIIEDQGECEQNNDGSSQRVTLSPDKIGSLRTATQARINVELKPVPPRVAAPTPTPAYFPKSKASFGKRKRK